MSNSIPLSVYLRIKNLRNEYQKEVDFDRTRGREFTDRDNARRQFIKELSEILEHMEKS